MVYLNIIQIITIFSITHFVINFQRLPHARSLTGLFWCELHMHRYFQIHKLYVWLTWFFFMLKSSLAEIPVVISLTEPVHQGVNILTLYEGNANKGKQKTTIQLQYAFFV